MGKWLNTNVDSAGESEREQNYTQDNKCQPRKQIDLVHMPVGTADSLDKAGELKIRSERSKDRPTIKAFPARELIQVKSRISKQNNDNSSIEPATDMFYGGAQDYAPDRNAVVVVQSFCSLDALRLSK